MRERSVARFLVAPDGFGKSEVALEYADVIFSFKNTFWFDARSPCFLRDLDRGSFADAIAGRDPLVKLVVFDGVPRLDPDRADALSSVIDDLLARGSEVVVTMPPSCDAFASRQSDRIRVSARDMMLSDAEVDRCRTGNECARLPASAVGSAERVPVIAWGGDSGGARFLEGIVGEDLPVEALAVIFEMLIAVSGSVAEIEPGALASIIAERDSDGFATNYPYLGIDADAERFEAPEMPIELVVRAFSSHLPSIARELSFGGVDDLAMRLATKLTARGRAERACDLVRCAASRGARERWLAAVDYDLAEQGCLAGACRLYASMRSNRSAAAGMLRVGEAWRRAVLGDEAAAAELSVRAAVAPSSSSEARALAATVAFGVSAPGERAGIVAALSSAVGCAGKDVESWVLSAPAHRRDVDRSLWWSLGVVALGSERGWACAARAWAALNDAGAPERALAASGAFVLYRVARSGAMANAPGDARCPDEAEEADLLDGIARHIVAFVNREAGEGRASLLAMLCAQALEGARDAAPIAQDAQIGSFAMRAVRRMQELVSEQRAEHERSCGDRDEERARSERGSQTRTSRRSARASTDEPPVLRMRLFGGLSVTIDGKRADSPLLKRKKVKTLLAVLALNAGREVSRDAIIRALWPESDGEAGRKNLYTLWGLARQALSLPDGTCPYLVRMQNGYKLDDRSFESDARRVDELTRALLFGHADIRTWADVLSELGRLCTDDLLPCETEVGVIVRRRSEYRMRIVDALVAASRRLVDEGDSQTALWFAREAYQRDREREDVYAALMRAQIAAGQRTSALETFFACRRFLADGLGIDPSAEIVALYRSIIEEQAIVDW